MDPSMPSLTAARRVIVGVATHKHIHVACAVDTLGVRLEVRSFSADSGGYIALAVWAESLGRVEAFEV